MQPSTLLDNCRGEVISWWLPLFSEEPPSTFGFNWDFRGIATLNHLPHSPPVVCVFSPFFNAETFYIETPDKTLFSSERSGLNYVIKGCFCDPPNKIGGALFPLTPWANPELSNCVNLYFRQAVRVYKPDEPCAAALWSRLILLLERLLILYLHILLTVGCYFERFDWLGELIIVLIFRVYMSSLTMLSSWRRDSKLSHKIFYPTWRKKRRYNMVKSVLFLLLLIKCKHLFMNYFRKKVVLKYRDAPRWHTWNHVRL